MKPVTVAGTNVHGAPIGSHTDKWVRVHPRWAMTSDEQGQPYWLHLESLEGTWEMPEDVAAQWQMQMEQQRMVQEQAATQQSAVNTLQSAWRNNLGESDAERASLPEPPACWRSLLGALRCALFGGRAATFHALAVASGYGGLAIALVLSFFPLFIGFAHDCWFAVFVRLATAFGCFVGMQLIYLRDLLYRRAPKARPRGARRHVARALPRALLTTARVCFGGGARGGVAGPQQNLGMTIKQIVVWRVAMIRIRARVLAGLTALTLLAGYLTWERSSPATAASAQCSKLCCGRDGEHVPDLCVRRRRRRRRRRAPWRNDSPPHPSSPLSPGAQVHQQGGARAHGRAAGRRVEHRVREPRPRRGRRPGREASRVDGDAAPPGGRALARARTRARPRMTRVVPRETR